MGYNGHETGCRCTACGRERALRAASSRRSKERAMVGDFRHRDVPALAAHVRRLRAAGCRRRWIAEAAGLGQGAVIDVLHEHRKAVTPATAEALLALTVRDVLACAAAADKALLPADGARRRLQALAVLGHPLYAIAAQAGLASDVVTRIARGKHRSVLAETLRKISAVYDQLWNVEGPSSVTRARAFRNGWVPPLAWDDDTIDDPAATPLVGEKTKTPRIVIIAEDAAELEHAGEGWGAIASKLGVTPETVKTAQIKAQRAARGTAA